MINRLINLIQCLNKDKPLSVIRLGNVEATQLLDTNNIFNQMKTNAGFFGNQTQLKKWSNDCMRALMTADCTLMVFSCPSFQVIDSVITKYNLFIPTLPYIEDVSFWVSLINQLNTNKFCFVSYFAKQMEQQAQLLNWIFPNKTNYKKSSADWKFVECENTIAGNEPTDKTFDEVLEELFQDCLKQDSDIYLLSCGCYGLPLQYKLKEAGKKSIYIGGMLQLLFGIKGKRFDEREIHKQHYNKYWKYPIRKPKNAHLVEGACYWGEESSSAVSKKSSPPKC